MALTNKERQQRHRAKLLRRLAEMEAALNEIEAKLDGTAKPAALAILAIARKGLGK